MRSARGPAVLAILLAVLAVLAAERSIAQSDVEIRFRVDMSIQTARGAFDPATGSVVVRGGLNGWGCSDPLTEVEPGIYEIEIAAPAHALGTAEYKFNIGCLDGGWETRGNRVYEVAGGETDSDADGLGEIVLDTVFFDDLADPGVDVELRFRVDMSVQTALGLFDPAIDTAIVRGALNAWGCSEPMLEVDDGVYEIEIQVPGHTIGAGEYKFNVSCGNRWEQGGNRLYQVSGAEPDADGDGFLEVEVPQRFFDDNEGGVDVEILFRVDMGPRISLGGFDPDLNAVTVRGGLNAWGCSDPLDEVDSGVYEIQIPARGHIPGTGEYKFNIDCAESGWETRTNRVYQVTGGEPDADGDGLLDIVIDPVPYFDDDGPSVPVDVVVTFRADLRVQIATGRFVPGRDTVVVRGDFNGWKCSEPFADAGAGIYELETLLEQAFSGTREYKFNIGCSDDGWEEGDNRTFTIGADAAPVTVERAFDDVTVGPVFVRGDTDTDGTINITDPIFALGFLFGGGVIAPGCHDALDANDDGSLNITDPIVLLGFLFAGGEPPPPPSAGGTSYTRGDCGEDPTFDLLPCAAAALVCEE